MRRITSAALLALLACLLVVPLIASGGGGNAPSCCCRRGGHHHCTCCGHGGDGKAPGFTTVSAKCPCSAAGATAVYSPAGRPAASALNLFALAARSVSLLQTQPTHGNGGLGAHPKRGPPSLLAY
jgi:hypothetical protein